MNITQRKGIILAGGTGSRLHPSTISVSKQLMPVYDKPMIYYPLSVLMKAGIRDILIITTPYDQAAFVNVLGDGVRWGLNIEYATQPSPDGLSQALIFAEDFLDGKPSALILGDNLFFGDAFNKTVKLATSQDFGATVFGYYVKDPQAYGVVGFDDNMAVKPSARGELEITALNEIYLKDGSLSVKILEEGTTWLDTGTHKSLLKAAEFVHVIEERQGRRICCPEVISYQNNWISADQLIELAQPLKKSGYGQYCIKVVEES